MIVWTIANQKGGVGKTTSTSTLGGLLAKNNKNVLLIDMDPHASLTYYFGIDSEEQSQSVYSLFMAHDELSRDRVLDSLSATKIDGLFIMPATMGLATLDKRLGTVSGMGLVLKHALSLIADDFDYVLIDCPPVLGVLMVNALACCSQIVIPVQTEFLALKGLDRMMMTLDVLAKSQAHDYPYTIVPTMYDKRTKASLGAYKQLKQQHGKQVWAGIIPIDTRLRDASQAHIPASHFAPSTRGVKAYSSLLNYLDSLEQTA